MLLGLGDAIQKPANGPHEPQSVPCAKRLQHLKWLPLLCGSRQRGVECICVNNVLLMCLCALRLVVGLQVSVDVPRTAPNVPFFHEPLIQQSLERLLYIWGIR